MTRRKRRCADGCGEYSQPFHRSLPTVPPECFSSHTLQPETISLHFSALSGSLSASRPAFKPPAVFLLPISATFLCTSAQPVQEAAEFPAPTSPLPLPLSRVHRSGPSPSGPNPPPSLLGRPGFPRLPQTGSRLRMKCV